MDLKLKGKKVLITGSSKGIGLATAFSFAQEGASVILNGRNHSESELEYICARMTALGHDASYVVADVSIPCVAKELSERYDDLDILVNNADGMNLGFFNSFTQESWYEAWQVKLQAYMRMSNAFANIMSSRGNGVICNVIGTNGYKVQADNVMVSTANASLMAFTQGLGAHSPSQGVRIFGINPGLTNTERSRKLLKDTAQQKWGVQDVWERDLKELPFSRMATPGEVGDFITFCCSPVASYLSGTCIDLDGGKTFK